MVNLILIRHTESEWNKKGLWTGLIDIGLSEKGKGVARSVGEKLIGMPIDVAFTSVLIRSKQTLEEIKKILNLSNLQMIEDKALNERNYGIYAGQNKWEVREKVGDEQFEKIRRGWDVPIEKGESLKDVYNRVAPYYQNEVLPKLKEGKNVLIVAHGNSLRALVKYLKNISNDDVGKLEIEAGEINVFGIDNAGKIISHRKL